MVPTGVCGLISTFFYYYEQDYTVSIWAFHQGRILFEMLESLGWRAVCFLDSNLPSRGFGFLFGHTRFCALGTAGRQCPRQVCSGWLMESMQLRSFLACSYLPYCKILVHSFLKTILLLLWHMVLIMIYLPHRHLHAYLQKKYRF